MNHTIVHFEIRGDDPKALADFYANLFGWKVQDASAPGRTTRWPPARGGRLRVDGRGAKLIDCDLECFPASVEFAAIEGAVVG